MTVFKILYLFPSETYGLSYPLLNFVRLSNYLNFKIKDPEIKIIDIMSITNFAINFILLNIEHPKIKNKKIIFWQIS